MEFPVRCFTCTGVIGNKYETYTRLLAAPFAKVEEWAAGTPTRSKAFAKHVLSTRKPGDQSRLTAYEVLNLLHLKKYCCRTLFLTYVDIPLPDPDYLEKTFSRVKFLNKRSDDPDTHQHRKGEDTSLEDWKRRAKETFIVAR